MPENHHGSRTQLAADRLRQLIIAGDLRPGQRLSERELGEYVHGLSRTPLREALKVLAAEGLVTISPNRGATVTALSVTEVEDILELIVGLEGLAVERACQRVSDADLAALEVLHRQMHDCFRDGRLMDYFETNQRIHQMLVDAAGNRELSRLYAGECARIRRYRYAGNRQHARWERAISEHDQMFLALTERDGPLLRELLRAHHRNGWRTARNLVAEELGVEETADGEGGRY